VVIATTREETASSVTGTGSTHGHKFVKYFPTGYCTTATKLTKTMGGASHQANVGHILTKIGLTLPCFKGSNYHVNDLPFLHLLLMNNVFSF